MPITIGSLPFDIIFFISGTIAKKNQWLKKLTQNGSYKYIVLTILCAICSIILMSILYAADYNQEIIPKKGEDPLNCDDDDIDMTIDLGLAYVGTIIFYGFCCIFISLGWIQFGGLYLDFRNNITNFFSSSAYTVYIIHPLIVCPITWSWTQIMYQINGVKFLFCDGKNSSKTHFGHDYLIWIGWIYTVILSLFILWPLAHFIRQLPGLNKIL